MANSPTRTTLNLAELSDRIERLRSDSAWKILPLSKKVIVLIQEHLSMVESSDKAATENKDSINDSKESLVRFVKGLAEGKTPSDADCISAALEAGIDKELTLSLRDRLFDRAND
ncbi:hypothetical protein HW132_12770 [Brasilonema sp. CT11]|nr:hypothetical protein [Brasilonema sp. CT11]